MRMSFTTSRVTKHKSWSIYLNRYDDPYFWLYYDHWLTPDTQILRDPSTDDLTHARLLRYTIRLSRKSGRLPRQLVLDIEPRQITSIGHGGSATIYQASYQHRIVAVKKSNLPHLAQCHKVGGF